MVLNRTEQKVMDRYPERFDHNLNDYSGGWSSKYGLFTQLHYEECQGRCSPRLHLWRGIGPIPQEDVLCECLEGNVFSIIADDAASFHEAARDMGQCECCGTWFQDPANS